MHFHYTEEGVHDGHIGVIISRGTSYSLCMKTAWFIQPRFGHLCCIAFVCLTRKVQGMLTVCS